MHLARTRSSTNPRRSALTRVILAALALALAVFSIGSDALAAGTVTLATKQPEEINGKWKLNFTINYGKKPDISYVPMIFSFTPTMLYERSLTDQSPEKPVITRMPLKGQQSINESMDVGFSDASGKTFNITKFDFVIRRDKGFEAGEYDLKITRSTDGAQMGQTIKLILKGDNPIVDRRAMVFAGEKKKKKPAEDEKKEPAADENKEGDTSAEASDSSNASDTTNGETPTEAPPPVEPKQGGCGCRVTGADDASSVPGGAFAVLALGLALAARRRR